MQRKTTFSTLALLTLAVPFHFAPAAFAADDATKTQVQAADKDGWVDLFNGKNLDGWTQRGGKATYTIEGDEIVGTTAPNTSNTFLCTDKDYGDFEFEFEFKVDPKMNSGVQFRSQSFDREHSIEDKGKTIKIPAHRVHGYQYEIDPSDRKWSAGVYDEGRRGWLYSLTDHPEAQKAFVQNEWNKARIEARGDHIQTWLNGIPVADLHDDMTLKGFIALQVHAVGANKDPLQIRWRNLRLHELPPMEEAKTDTDK